jgi:hypothetical protein
MASHCGARVQSQVTSCENPDGQSGNVAAFFPPFYRFRPLIITPSLPYTQPSPPPEKQAAHYHILAL